MASSSTASNRKPQPQPMVPLSNILSLRPPPRSVWRYKDSSEKTPSTAASDGGGEGEGYIYPAAMVSSPDLCSHPPLLAPPPPALVAPPKRTRDAPVRGLDAASPTHHHHGRHHGGNRAHSNNENSAIPTSTYATINSSSSTHNPTPTSIPPPLAPLEPPFPPPQRTPTPAGLPSYESSQRAAEARLAVHIVERRLGLGPGALRPSASAPAPRRGRGGRWRERRTRKREAGRGSAEAAAAGAEEEAAPAASSGRVGGRRRGDELMLPWRPVVSQHAMGRHHPYGYDYNHGYGYGYGYGHGYGHGAGYPSSPAPPYCAPYGPGPSRLGLRHLRGHGVEAEAAARGDRTARPVRLEDYYFLRDLDGVGGSAARVGAGTGSRAEADEDGGSLPCAMWRLPVWCCCSANGRGDGQQGMGRRRASSSGAGVF